VHSSYATQVKIKKEDYALLQEAYFELGKEKRSIMHYEKLLKGRQETPCTIVSQAFILVAQRECERLEIKTEAVRPTPGVKF